MTTKGTEPDWESTKKKIDDSLFSCDLRAFFFFLAKRDMQRVIETFFIPQCLCSLMYGEAFALSTSLFPPFFSFPHSNSAHAAPAKKKKAFLVMYAVFELRSTSVSIVTTIY